MKALLHFLLQYRIFKTFPNMYLAFIALIFMGKMKNVFCGFKKYLLLCMYGHLKIGLCTSSGTLSFCLKWNWEVELSWSGLYSKCF